MFTYLAFNFFFYYTFKGEECEYKCIGFILHHIIAFKRLSH